jgi:hypothetical protein
MDSWDWVRDFLVSAGYDDVYEDDSEYKLSTSQEDIESEQDTEMSSGNISESMEDEESSESEYEPQTTTKSLFEQTSPHLTIDNVVDAFMQLEPIQKSKPIEKKPAQTQTPPITPSPSKKRPLPEEFDEDQEEEPPTQSLLSRIHSDSSKLDSHIDDLTSQNSVYTSRISALEDRNRDLERRLEKRRKVDGDNWVGAVGRYTVAGIVGGIVTFAGLLWSGTQG